MHEQLRKLFAQTLFIGVGGFWGGFLSLDLSQKIPAPIKIASALPPPPNSKPPPKTRILWTWRFSCRKKAEILGAHKIGAANSGPRIADTDFTDTRTFLRERPRGVENSGGWKTYRKFGEKPLPKNVFGPPPTIRFPPPFLATLCHFP